MCDKCVELDIQIARYRLLDRKLEVAAMEMVADLEAQKVALHPLSE
ncbi:MULTISPECIES: hypothetical protein [unclassified Bradyrhizobium]|nr:hypothetical protein [Bradyrhizobium sp. CB2312]WFU75213.1 hypothetical protein QA642_14895 [Bradyrhizobium sp. CB2312]